MEIDIQKILMQRLESKGMQPDHIPCFIRDIENAFINDPYISLNEANGHLHFMGWDDIQLDYHTFQLAQEKYNMEGRKICKSNRAN